MYGFYVDFPSTQPALFVWPGCCLAERAPGRDYVIQRKECIVNESEAQ